MEVQKTKIKYVAILTYEEYEKLKREIYQWENDRSINPNLFEVISCEPKNRTYLLYMTKQQYKNYKDWKEDKYYANKV